MCPVEPEASPVDEESAAIKERVGEVISGRYRIDRLLGEGGMGAVYLAEHTHMRKRVALKLLHPEMSKDEEVIARFEREAQATAHLDHPHIAGATDFGRTEDGGFFLVLEYLEGTSLRKALEEGALPPARALRIARQIALALERAHDRGIVHRDLKPENVMLVQRNTDSDFVKVLDFGIAKLTGNVDARAGSNQPLTRLGTILGTPEYMAPEQALGEPVTAAADLYGLGVILYELLTGRHPFEPPDRMAMLSFHIVAPVPPMSDRGPPHVNVPPRVEAVVRSLLEKDKAQRPASARALIQAIESAAAEAGIDLRSSSIAPSAPPSRTSGPSTSQPNPTPQWANSDGYAKTSHAVSSRTLVRGGGPASIPQRRSNGLFDTLRSQPRPLLLVIGAALPVGFILVVAMILLSRGSKTPAVEDASTTAPTSTASILDRFRSAPADRVAAARTKGADGLAELSTEFPSDVGLRKQVAIAYATDDRPLEAMRAVRALVEQDKNAIDDAIVRLVSNTAAGSSKEAADEAFALLETPLGKAGIDALVELDAKTSPAPVRVRAHRVLAKPEVRERAADETAVLLDLRDATTCTKKHALLERAGEKGDARVLVLLKALKSRSGCGFLGRRDCWSCLRKDDVLDDAISAIERRAPH